MSDGNNGSSLSSFLLGALIGGGLALLYTPQSGKETRQQILDRTQDAKDRANAAIGQAKNVIHDKKDQLTAAVDAGIQAIHSTRDKVADEANKVANAYNNG